MTLPPASNLLSAQIAHKLDENNAILCGILEGYAGSVVDNSSVDFVVISEVIAVYFGTETSILQENKQDERYVFDKKLNDQIMVQGKPLQQGLTNAVVKV